MLISRKEFHQRADLNMMTVEKTQQELMDVDILLEEAKKDAPFRNHSYMFEEGVNFDTLPLQEETVGIKRAFPDIKTEGQRLKHIEDEMKNDIYAPVPVLRDIDHPDIINIEDGFHRIFVAKKLGMKKIRTLCKYGKFNLTKCILLEDLSDLLEMMYKLFGQNWRLKELHDFLVKAMEKKCEIMDWNIVYGRKK